jgi:hypothetical protein
MTRERLPNRRRSTSLEFECQGLRFTCTYSRFADGRIAEIFITNYKAGSQAGAIACDAAISTSLALQFGCPFETLRSAVLPEPDGRASSPLGHAIDLIAEEAP